MRGDEERQHKLRQDSISQPQKNIFILVLPRYFNMHGQMVKRLFPLFLNSSHKKNVSMLFFLSVQAKKQKTLKMCL